MYDFVIAINNQPCHTYDFLKENETEQEGIERAREHYCNEYEDYKKYITEYPDRADYWNQRKEETWNILMGDFSVMSFDDYLKWQKEKLTSDAPKEIDKETFEKMLNVLPPLKWETNHNIESFCMREMFTGTITSQYAYNLVDGKYYTKMVDVMDKNTWIFKCF